MRRPTTLRLLLEMERPTSGQFAVSAFLGIVVGALGGGFSRVLELFLLILVALGVWKIVTILGVIANALDEQSEPARPLTTAIYGGRRR